MDEMFIVIFGVVVAVGGTCHAINAFRMGDKIQPEIGAMYLAASMFGIMLGLGIMAIKIAEYG